jgi:hypothetical protein
MDVTRDFFLSYFKIFQLLIAYTVFSGKGKISPRVLFPNIGPRKSVAAFAIAFFATSQHL